MSGDWVVIGYLSMEGRLRGTHLRRDDRFVLDGEHLAELERGASHAAERHREPFRVRLRHEHRVAGEDGFDGCGGGFAAVGARAFASVASPRSPG